MGRGSTLSSPRSQSSKKKTSQPDDDSTGMEIQGPVIEEEGNVPVDLALEDSVSLNRPAEVFDDVSTGQTCIHDNPFAVAGNDDEARIYDNKPEVVKNVIKGIISRVREENLAECPGSGSFEKSDEEEGKIAEAPSEGEDEHEVPAEIDISDDEDEFPGMSAYEKLRERNIRERKELLKVVMVEINEAKQDMPLRRGRLRMTCSRSRSEGRSRM